MALRFLSNGLMARSLHNNVIAANVHTSSALWARTFDKTRHLKETKDEGTKGESSIVLDAALNKWDNSIIFPITITAYTCLYTDCVFFRRSIFPDEDLPNRDFFGTKFMDLPIVNIKTTPNNTLFNVTDAKGTTIFTWSSGCEGFKNARKGTNIAAQTAAATIATVCVQANWSSHQSQCVVSKISWLDYTFLQFVESSGAGNQTCACNSTRPRTRTNGNARKYS